MKGPEIDPRDAVTPDDKVIKPEFDNTSQVSVHLNKYQKKWMESKKEDGKFNLSGQVRGFIDYLIAKDEMPLPEEVLTEPSDVEKIEESGLEVFITE